MQKQLMPLLLTIFFIPNVNLFAFDIGDISKDFLKNPQFNIPKPKIKKWTVAIYMNGKSNIKPFALNDLNRIETQGSDENMNIVVEIGRSRGFENDTEADGDWAGVRRFYVVKDHNINKVNSILLEDLGDIDMGDWRKAAQFLAWVKENYPAERVMFMIWDHGWGWIDPLKPGENLVDKAKSISHDFVTGNYIKTTDLVKIFKAAGPVDFYTSMACFMQMAEVAYEIKDYAEVIAGSEEVIQLPSFNFEDFLAAMKKNPISTPQQAGTYLTETFKQMYSRPQYQDLLISTKYSIQLSAIRDKALMQKKKVTEIFNRLKSNIENELVISNVFLNSDRTGNDYPRTHGISLHIPGMPGNLIDYHKTYKSLAFGKETG